MSAIGERIRAAAAARKIKLKQLAEQARIDNSYLHACLRGERRPSVHVFGSLGRVLGVRAEWLSDGEEPMLPAPSAPPPKRIDDMTLAELEAHLAEARERVQFLLRAIVAGEPGSQSANGDLPNGADVGDTVAPSEKGGGIAVGVAPRTARGDRAPAAVDGVDEEGSGAHAAPTKTRRRKR